MADNIENIIKNIELTMRSEKIPLTKKDKSRLRLCLKEKKDIQEIIQEIIKNRSFNKDFVLVRKID